MKNNKKKKYILYTIFAFIILFSILYKLFHKPVTPFKPSDNTIKYSAVYEYNYDGDTAVFYIKELGRKTVRFIGVDSPEKDEEGYLEARDYTNKELSNGLNIILELDPHSPDYDKYERLLAWVWIDNELIQTKLITSNNATIKYLDSNYLYADYLYSINVTK